MVSYKHEKLCYLHCFCQGGHVSSMDGKTVLFLLWMKYFLPFHFWEEMEETPKFDKY